VTPPGRSPIFIQRGQPVTSLDCSFEPSRSSGTIGTFSREKCTTDGPTGLNSMGSDSPV
jgi:hypothetical protein